TPALQDRTPQEHRRAMVFLAALLCVSLVFAYVIGRAFLGSLAYAVIIATVFHLLQTRFRKRVRNAHRAALLSTGVVFLLIVVLFTIVLDVAAIQAISIGKAIAER